MQAKVIYEDNHLIVVYKPAGVLVQGDASGHANLVDIVKKHLKEKYQKPGNVFLGLVHRLDRPVSGLVLFAKTSKGAARVSEQLRNHEITKIYHALVEGRVEKRSGTLRHYIYKDEKQKKGIIQKKEGRGDLALLHYEVIKSSIENTLLKIQLETGRFHQIRAQLAAIGHPIVGDVKYGAKKSLPDQSIALYASEMTFRKATTDEEISVKLDPSDLPSILISRLKDLK